MADKREIISLIKHTSKRVMMGLLEAIVEYNNHNENKIKIHEHPDGIRINLDILCDRQSKVIHSTLAYLIEKEMLIYNDTVE